MKNSADTSKYRVSIVSMDDNGTGKFTGFTKKLQRSKAALIATYIAAAVFTALSFVFQEAGLEGNIIGTVLSFACIFLSMILWVEIIVHNSMTGKHLHTAVIVLLLIIAMLAMEEMCTGYPSSSGDLIRVEAKPGINFRGF